MTLRLPFPLNNFVHATAVCAILFVLSQVPGVPDHNRSAAEPIVSLDDIAI
jgi:hypothetical protein